MVKMSVLKKLIASTLVAAMTLVLFAGCTQQSSSSATPTLSIPDEYKTGIVINHFTGNWPASLDGSDLIGSVQYSNADEGFTTIDGYLNGATLSDSDRSGNFVPDFRYVKTNAELNGYDFRFFDDSLIMRDPTGACFVVDLSADDCAALKNYILQVRIGAGPPTELGAYTADRPLTDEDRALFESVMKDQTEAEYIPVAVATQVVAGTNYRFTCSVTPAISDPEPYAAYVYIFKPLDNSAPKLVDITTERAEDM